MNEVTPLLGRDPLCSVDACVVESGPPSPEETSLRPVMDSVDIRPNEGQELPPMEDLPSPTRMPHSPSPLASVFEAAGSCCIHFLPLFCVAAAVAQPNLFGVLFIGLFLAAILFPRVLPNDALRRFLDEAEGKGVVRLPPLVSSAPAVLVLPSVAIYGCMVVSLAGVCCSIAYVSVCAADGASDYFMWRVLGQECQSQTKFVVGNQWPFVLVGVGSVCSAVYSRVQFLPQDPSAARWPLTITPVAAVHYSLSAAPAAGTLSIVCAALVVLRQCLICVLPLVYMCFSASVAVVPCCSEFLASMVRPNLWSSRIAMVLLACALLSYCGAVAYCAAAQTDPGFVLTLVLGVGQSNAPDEVFLVLLSCLAFVVSVVLALCAQWNTTVQNNSLATAIATGGGAPSSDDFFAGCAAALRRVASFVSVPLCLIANLCLSWLGIVWAVLWAVLLCTPHASLSHRLVVIWSVGHFVMFFIGGFSYFRDDETVLKSGLWEANHPVLCMNLMILSCCTSVVFLFCRKTLRSFPVQDPSVRTTSFDAELEYRKQEREPLARREKDAPAVPLVDYDAPADTANVSEGAFTPRRRSASRLQAIVTFKYSSVLIIIQKYFHIITLMALCTAAVAHVNVVHVVFLFLFAVLVILRQLHKFLWAWLLLYTVLLCEAMYIIRVAVAQDNGTLETLGFLSHGSVWQLWPYYLWTSIFAVQFYLIRHAIAKQNAAWMDYLRLAERYSVSLITFFNCLLFAFIASAQGASVIGFFYLTAFIVTTSLVMLTSFHTPPPGVLHYWYGVVFVLSSVVTVVYLYQLEPETMEDVMTSVLSPLGFNTVNAGIAPRSQRGQENFFGFWTKIVSLLLSIVQLRVWHDNVRTYDPQRASEEEARFLHLPLMKTVVRIGRNALRLIAVYSAALAITAVMTAAIISYKPLSLINALYLALGIVAMTFHRYRTSERYWKFVQVVGALVSLGIYTLHQDFWGSAIHRATPWKQYVGVQPDDNDDYLWRSTMPSMIVFFLAALHANAKVQASPTRRGMESKRSQPSFMVSPLPPAPEAAGAEGAAAESTPSTPGASAPNTPGRHSTMYALTHPTEFLGAATFHCAIGALFLNAALRHDTVYGPCCVLIGAVCGFVGRTRVTRGLWLGFLVFALLLLLFQYVSLLGLPPGWAFSVELGSQYNTYLNISPSAVDVSLTGVLWAAVALHAIAIQSEHESRSLNRRSANAPMTVTYRLNFFADRIGLARKHNAVHFLERILPVPVPLTLDPSDRTFWSRSRMFAYQYYHFVPLVAAFVHAIYNATSSLDLSKLASLIVSLVFVQLSSSGALLWHGNNYWSWIVRFHVLWFLMRMILFVPDLGDNRQIACALQFVGFKAAFNNRGPSFSCSGDTFTRADMFFHIAIVAAMWAQTTLFEQDEFIVVLHYRHKKEVDAQSLGQLIRDSWLASIQFAKEEEEKSRQQRAAQLEQIRQEGQNAERRKSTVVASPPRSATNSPRPQPQTTIDPIALRNVEATCRLLQGGRLDGSPQPSPRGRQPKRVDSSTVRTYFETTLMTHRTPQRKATFVVGNETFDVQSLAVVAGFNQDREAEDDLDSSVMSPTDSDADNNECNVSAGSTSVAGATVRRRLRSSRRFPMSKPTGTTLLLEWVADTVDTVILWLDRRSIAHAATRIKKGAIEARFLTFPVVLWRFVLSYTDRICYVFFCAHFMLSPSIATAFPPITVFMYAAAMNPRPHRVYWVVIFVYFQLMILAKSLVKAAQCGSVFQVSMWYGRVCVGDNYLLDTVMELVCILCIIVHVQHLRRWGLWDDSELRLSAAAATPQRTDSVVGSEPPHESPCSSVTRFAVEFARNIGRDDIKTGVDLYRACFAAQLVTFVYLFFAYYRLVGIDDSVMEALEHSILPGALAVVLIVLFTVMLVDRILYLRRTVIGKYCFLVVSVFGYHALLIWWFVTKTEFVHTYYRDASFNLRGAFPTAMVVYVLIVLYLFYSSTQVKQGFHPHAKHIVFAGSYTNTEFVNYYIARLIPFAYEIRCVLDWTVVTTNLKLSYWIKLEDVCHELYMTLNDRYDTTVIMRAKRGDSRLPYPGLFKYPIGIVYLILLIFLLLAPLLLYSSFSPAIEPNPILTISVELSVDGFPSLFTSENRFGSGSACCRMNTSVTNLIERTRLDLVGSGLAHAETVQIMQMSQFSSNMWSVSPPVLAELLHILNSSREVELVLQVVARGIAEKASIFNAQRLKMDSYVQQNLSAMLQGQQDHIVIPHLYTPFLFNLPQGDFRFFGQPRPSSNTVRCYLGMTNVSMSASQFFSLWCDTLFELSNPPSTGEGWNNLSPQEWNCARGGTCPDYDDAAHVGTSPLYFVIASNAVFSTSLLQSVGIVAAYTTFVFAIGRVLRFAVTGGAYRVELEDIEDPLYLVHLIEYLFMARAQGNYQLEEEVYTQLINTLRLPDVLEAKTRKKME